MLAAVITGPKKSGKTSLLALVAEALEKHGHRVAVIKYSSNPLEKGNTDAFWLMREQRTVVNVSPHETAVIVPRALPFEELIQHIEADVFLLEGGCAPASIPRVLCSKNPEDSFAGEYGEKDFTVLATHGATQALPGIPHFEELDLQSAEKIADIILKNGARVRP